MLKKIKKFFQSIAGKIASGWNSIKNWWSSNKANRVSDPKENRMLPLVEESNGKIVLVIPQDVDIYQIFPNNKDGHGNVIDGEFRFDPHNHRQIYITGRYDSKTMMENGNIHLSINSVGTLDGKEVYGDNNPEGMKKFFLGFSNTTSKIGDQSLSNTPNSEATNISVTPAAATDKSVNV